MQMPQKSRNGRGGGPIARCSIAAGLAMLAALPSVPQAGAADDYPSRTIKIVVPVGPGGPTDIVGRLVAQMLQKALKQNVIVENHPGAGGATGTKATASADPDGYTLVVGNAPTLAVIPVVMRNPGYDPLKSFVPVAKVSESALVLAVSASVPATTVQGFVDYAKARPGKLSYASAGAGNITHLLGELFKTKTGIDVVHIPYKSGAEMITALLSEQTQMAFPDISILLPMVREKKLKALAVTTARRHPLMPEAPTMIESGVGDFNMPFWTAIMAPAGTPEPIVEKLHDAINAGLKTPEMQTAFARLGAVITPGSRADFAQFVAAETAKWTAVAKTAHMYAR
jgi:tripartite-type tricarboxylate transporter receptor subunit TctC